jgi:hypothetical protein
MGRWKNILPTVQGIIVQTMTDNTKNKIAPFLEGQGLNLISLSVLFTLMLPAWRHQLMDTGELWGITSRK